MPPHIFHALSDDPARWERQFGCMAAFFQMLEHHPRFFRKRTAPRPYTTSTAASHPPAHSKASNKPAASAKAVHCNGQNGQYMQETKACACVKRTRTSERAPPAGRLQDAPTHSRRFKNESPSILDSSRATHTIREPPRKSFDGATSPDDHCCITTNPATSEGSRSLPGSPHVRFSKTRDHARSQFVLQKPLTDKPTRVSLDGGQGLQVAAASRIRHSHRDQSYHGLCKDPLQELEESIRTLAKIQQATQKFVDGFEVRQDDLKLQPATDEPEKKSNSGNNWWNAGKARFFQRSHSHAAAQKSSMEGAATAARTSSFDYTEAIRISQKIQETPARLSLDGRELVPKAVMKLREAMRLGSTTVNTPGLCKSSECVTDKGQRSNIIARLMGLDDLPSCSTARQDVYRDAGNTRLKEPRPLKDLLRFDDQPRAADCRTTTDYPLKDMLRFDDHPGPADCSMTTDHPLKDLLRFDDHPRPADCSMSTDHCMTTQKPSRKYDAAMAPKFRKNIEAASAHAIKNTAHVSLQQAGPGGVFSREVDCKVITEFNYTQRTNTNLKNSCTLERPAVVLSKHALEVMPSPSLIRKRTCADNFHVHKADHYNDPDSVAGFRSELEERKGRPDVQERICRIVVMKPRKMRTLSMETHFPFDVPSIDKEYAEQLPISSSDHRPKLQAATAADSIRQRDMANHRLDYKRKCSNDFNQKELAGAGRKYSSPPQLSRSRKSNDQSCKLIAIADQPAATPPTIGNVRCRKLKQQPAAADHGKPGSTDSEKIQYNKTKKSLSKFSEFYGGTGAASTAKAGGGSKANNTQQAGKQGAGDRTMTMRTGLVRADILESAKQLCLHSHGSCTDKEVETTTCSSRGRSAPGGHASMKEKRCADDSLNSVSQESVTECVHAAVQPCVSPCTLVHTQPPPSLSCAAPTEANVVQLTTRGETDVSSVFEHPNDVDGEEAAPEEGLLNGQFEYVEAILERARLLADKEDVVQSHHHLIGDCAINLDPAIFLEIERSWATSGSPAAADSAVSGRQRRRLIFDCVHEILTQNSFADGCKRGLLMAVWKELKRLVQVVAAPSSPPTSLHKPVRLCWVLARQIAVERSQEACWTRRSSPPLSFSHHVSCCLEKAIFQDLLLELIG